MSVDLNGFDASQEPESSFEPIPEGQYMAVITSSEMKPTKAGDGTYVSLKVEIVDGQYKGRVLFDNLNLNNKNETAVQIARRALADICLAVGVPRPSNTAELHNKPLKIDLRCEKRKDTGDVQNRIKKYLSATGVSHVTPSQPAASSSTSAPWKR